MARLSASRFKASALGGYERGERSISLERFCDLAGVYGVPPDRLLAQVLDRVAPEGRMEVVLDLRELDLLPGQEPQRAGDLVARVRADRGGEQGDEVALRAGDLEALALASGLSPADLIRQLEPALRVRRPPARDEQTTSTAPSP